MKLFVDYTECIQSSIPFLSKKYAKLLSLAPRLYVFYLINKIFIGMKHDLDELYFERFSLLFLLKVLHVLPYELLGTTTTSFTSLRSPHQNIDRKRSIIRLTYKNCSVRRPNSTKLSENFFFQCKRKPIFFSLCAVLDIIK